MISDDCASTSSRSQARRPLTRYSDPTGDETMNCTDCGQLLKESWKVCPACGQSINTVRGCRECGQETEPHWKICPACGNSLSDASGAHDEAIGPSAPVNGTEARNHSAQPGPNAVAGAKETGKAVFRSIVGVVAIAALWLCVIAFYLQGGRGAGVGGMALFITPGICAWAFKKQDTPP